MRDPEPDRPPLGLGDIDLAAADLDNLRFPVVVRGYRMADVDAVIDRLQAELRRREEQVAALEGMPGAGAPAAPAPVAAAPPTASGPQAVPAPEAATGPPKAATDTPPPSTHPVVDTSGIVD